MAQILGTGYQRSGKLSRVTADGSALVHSKWNANWQGDDLDTVNFESVGVDEGILGIEWVDLSFGGDWDAHDNPLDDPPGLFPRDDLPDLNFYVNTTDAVYWNFPYARLRSANNSTEVKGKVAFECSGKNQGDWNPPTGSV